MINIRQYAGAVVLAACSIGALPAGAQAPQTLGLPPRSATALSGTDIYNLVRPMTRDDREKLIFNEVTQGNVPNFLRQLKPVTSTLTISGTPRTCVFYTTPDYLAVGSDVDFFRIPLTPIAAQWIADRAKATLPTRKMVDLTYQRAEVKLAPSPISPATTDIMLITNMRAHHLTIEGQRSGNALGLVVGGIKKDVVVTPQLPTRPPPARVAIYGWHQLSGTAIQPLSLVHEETYVDYSHGIRLVGETCLLDGVATSVTTVLASSSVADLLTDEGASTVVRYPVSTPPGSFPYNDAFGSAGRTLSWTDRFTGSVAQAFSPSAPGGDGNVWVVKDPSGGVNTARIGYATDRNYSVRALLYCNYRPSLSADGYERIGIFVRDDGNGIFEGQNVAGTIKGNNYSLTYDSHTGQFKALKTVNGVPSDLVPVATVLTSSAWREFRIDAVDTSLKFYLDGALVASAVDSTHVQGSFGIGYHEYFTTNANILGTFADRFEAVALANSAVAEWMLY